MNASSRPKNPNRLGQNKGGYLGGRISIETVLEEIERTALETGWLQECFYHRDPLRLCAYTRSTAVSRRRLYISTGIHGDEPAGPLAALQLIQENRWPDGIGLWLCPCLNPTGFSLNRRENAHGVDLNRDYRHLNTPEVRAHAEWLRRQPDFDLTVLLHEDWEANGFYLYELNPSRLPSSAEAIIERVAQVCPIESAQVVDNWPVRGGIIQPQVEPSERPQWPEAVFLIANKSRQSLTLEAPSDYPIATRVQALVAAVRTIFERTEPTSTAPKSL